MRKIVQSDELEFLKIEKLKEAVSVGAEQAERGEFVEQSITEIAEEAKLEKYGKRYTFPGSKI